MVLGSIARVGEITEIVGRLSSGRTSLLMAVLRRATHAGAATALVDVDDAFDAVSAARAGVELDRARTPWLIDWRETMRARPSYERSYPPHWRK